MNRERHGRYRMDPLSRRRFAANTVHLPLHSLAYNVGNFRLCRQTYGREALECFALDQQPSERCVWMTAKSAFLAPGAPVFPAWVHGSNRVAELALLVQRQHL